MQNSQKFQPELSKMYRLQKIDEMCRAMTNEAKSKELLVQYEDSAIIKLNSKLDEKAKKQWKYYEYFDLAQMIHMKGNKKHQNPDLKRFLIFKLYSDEDISSTARKQLWLQFTDIKEKPGLYQVIKQQTSSQRYFDESIHKDLNRTKGKPQHLKMTENVLTTMAKYNPFIGYCQGFNNIIIFLIQEGFTEEQSFFVWKYISLEILPTDYYTSMISILSDVDIIMSIFSTMNPKCTESFEFNKQKLTSMILPWLICLFTRDPVHQSVTVLFWDFILVEGLIAVYKAAITLLMYVEDILEDTHDQNMVRNAEQKLKKLSSTVEIKKIKKMMQTLYINPRILTLCRSCLCQKYEEKQKQMNISRKPVAKQCNTSSHICIQQLQNNRYELMLRSYECQIFRTNKPVNLIENYLDLIDTKDFSSQKKHERVEDTILIGRINHVCSAKEKQKIISYRDSEQRSRTESRLFNYQGMERTESMAFLQVLMQNPSFSNLLEHEQLWEQRYTIHAD